MGRSVSIPSNAVAVAYASYECDDEYFAHEDFTDRIDFLRDEAKAKYKSLSDCDRWLGREDRAVLENSHCYITVSEYCGLVAVAIVAKDDNNLAANWCNKVDLAPLAACFGERLISQGRFSNGEQIFYAASGKTGALGIGYTSKDGWL